MLGHLITAKWRTLYRPPAPGPVHRQTYLGVARAGGHARQQAPHEGRAGAAIAGAANHVFGTGGADVTSHTGGHRLGIDLHLDDDGHAAMLQQHVAQTRNTQSLSTKRELAARALEP